MPRPNGPQFQFLYEEDPDNEAEQHSVVAKHIPTNTVAGFMTWRGGGDNTETGHLQSIEVNKEFRRQGVATDMWNYARQFSQQNKNVTYPVHSNFRTPEGDAWARAVTEDGTRDWLPGNQYEE